MKPKEELLKDIAEKAPFLWEWPRVGVFVPYGATIPGICFHSFIDIFGQVQAAKIDVGRVAQLDWARTLACEAMVDHPDLTHVLQLDADHKHPRDIVQQLARRCVETMDSGDPIEVIGGYNYRRLGIGAPCCYQEKEGYTWDGWPTDEMLETPPPHGGKGPDVVEMAAVGSGSLLIAQTALERIEWPWFYFDYTWPSFARGNNLPPPGEDIQFAMRCRRAGVKQWVDRKCVSPHLAEVMRDGKEYEMTYGKVDDASGEEQAGHEGREGAQAGAA